MVFANDNLNLTKNATSAILIEATTGNVLYNKNANSKQSVASLTKMMSLIVIFEFMEKGGMTFDEMVTTSENAKSTGGTQLWLDTGDVLSVRDLLKGVVMASANDAMVSLAEKVAGTEEAFVLEMNKKAKELGLKNTYFKNCTGFDEEGHYSSSYDLALIAKELIKHEQIFEFSSVYESYIKENTSEKEWIVNTNKLVRFYQGADGLKTGWTEDAGSCIAVTAKKDNLRLIAITLGYKDTTTRNSETMELLNYGFNQYKASLLYKKGSKVGAIKIDGIDKKVNVYAKEDIILFTKKTETKEEIIKKIKITNNKLPLKKESTVASFYVKEKNKILSKTDLYIKEEIESPSLMDYYLSNIRRGLFIS